MCGHISPLARDFHRLLKNVKKLSNNQVKVVDYADDICEFTLEIKPNDGYYNRGMFEFKIEPQEPYPQKAPKVQCLTDIYHPNINDSYDRDVCLSLFDDWTAQNDLEDCVQGLLFLLYNPNLEDPLNPYFDPGSEEQISNFADDVRTSLEGGGVEGHYYERNIVEEEESEEIVLDEGSGTQNVDTTVTRPEAETQTLSPTTIEAITTVPTKSYTPPIAAAATTSTTQLTINEMVRQVTTATQTTIQTTPLDHLRNEPPQTTTAVATAATAATVTIVTTPTTEARGHESTQTMQTTPQTTAVTGTTAASVTTTTATTTEAIMTTPTTETNGQEATKTIQTTPQTTAVATVVTTGTTTAVTGTTATATSTETIMTTPTTQTREKAAAQTTTAVATAITTGTLATTPTTETRGHESTQTIQTTTTTVTTTIVTSITETQDWKQKTPLQTTIKQQTTATTPQPPAASIENTEKY